jgi:hypothetical protein
MLVQVGVLIGKAGDTIRYLQYNSGAKIQITRDMDADPYAATRPVEIIGTLDNINKAEKLISAVIAEVSFLFISQCAFIWYVGGCFFWRYEIDCLVFMYLSAG